MARSLRVTVGAIFGGDCMGYVGRTLHYPHLPTLRNARRVQCDPMEAKPPRIRSLPPPPMDRSYVVRYGPWGPQIYVSAWTTRPVRRSGSRPDGSSMH